MKYLRSIALLAILFATSTAVLAQPVTIQKNMRAVAFTKADRSQLWIKRFDTAAYVALKANPTSNTAFKHIADLAVLDQSSDGLTLLLGGSFTFRSLWGSNTDIVWTGIISVPRDSLNDPNLLSHIHFLKTAVRGTGHFRPIGVIAPNRKWFGAMVTASPGTDPGVRFYHGSLDSNWNDADVRIDSATPSSQTNSPNDWHMSNLAMTPDGNNMFAVVCEQPSNPNTFTMWIYRWFMLGNFGPSFYESKITNWVPLMPDGGFSPDTLFALSVRAKDNGQIGELGLTTRGNPDILYFDFNYQNYATLNANGRTISRSSIPSDQYFFAGQNVGPYQEDLVDAAQHGMAGDISFTAAGDTALFITHPAVDGTTVGRRDSLSGIYLYDNSGATLVYNDSSAQELQPVLVTVAGYETWYPGLSIGNTTSFTFPQTDTNHSSAPKNLTITDTSRQAPATIDSIRLSHGKEFSLSGVPITSPIQPLQSATIGVVFTPLDTIGGVIRRDTITIYSSESMNPVIRIPVSGTAHVQAPPPPPPPGSVQEVDPSVFGMTVQPNPFTMTTQVHLTAPESGPLGIIVHDALGRTVYASDLRKTAIGTDAEFTFDAHSLGLPVGVYYVTAIAGGHEASRQVVFVR
ncbi:MAG: hypothetical protein Q8922_10000 [Bacteroidota bacterium]|nr:hypothetical protein [Bacteroidota bacterium]MDP4232386.1 hypothetical protein [Bacteroidota bacterium]MDP4241523.1 hypothetical protein [Bacteroidota bacterium]MDP4288257.1 hypothetical protein [Bacteroidota bacterium]